jgi:hypothetical protein
MSQGDELRAHIRAVLQRWLQDMSHSRISAAQKKPASGSPERVESDA